MNLIKQYLLYLIRWQLSTPILAIVISLFPETGGTHWIPSIVANLVGGLIFFWIDKLIFKEKKDKSNKN